LAKQFYSRRFFFKTDIWSFERKGFYRKEFLPENRGFDSHYGYLVGAEGHFNHTECIAGYCGVDFRIDGKSTNSTFGKYNSDLFAARVEQIVDDHAFDDEPLFLYAGLQNVHYPLEAPAEFVKKYEWIDDANRRHFAAMTAAMDVTVGRIVDAFKAKGVWDETIVLFTTDNGGSTLYGGNNWPLRGLKNTLWEGGIRGIGSIKVPRTMPGVRTELMHVSDVFPTLVDFTQCPVSSRDWEKLDGSSQSEMLKFNAKSAIDHYLINIDPHSINRHAADDRKWKSKFDVRVQSGLRWNNWKLLTGNPEPNGYPSGNIYPPEWPQKSGESGAKTVAARSARNVHLFDIDADPMELNELSDFHPQVVETMLEMLAIFNETAVPVLKPGKADPNADPALNDGFWQPWITDEFEFDSQL